MNHFVLKIWEMSYNFFRSDRQSSSRFHMPKTRTYGPPNSMKLILKLGNIWCFLPRALKNWLVIWESLSMQALPGLRVLDDVIYEVSNLSIKPINNKWCNSAVPTISRERLKVIQASPMMVLTIWIHLFNLAVAFWNFSKFL